jgi:maleylacetate reductase
VAADPFVWRDAGRTVVFGRATPAGSPPLLADHGFEPFDLFTTARALSEVPSLGAAAAEVRIVGSGQVPDTAAALLDSSGSKFLVAYGGGRVVDTAKAVASVSGASVAAIPTTLSGAEMTGIHRIPAGAESRVNGLVRPELVVADPEAMTSLPEDRLRASAMNALGHGADSLYTPFANPISKTTALLGAELIATALDQPRESRDRGALALGAILCGYAIDSGMFAIHHVACQTLVRVCGTPHSWTNAAILPRAMAFMEPRAPDAVAALATAIGTSPDGVEERILELGGRPQGLGSLGGDESRIEEAVESMLQRKEMAFTPGGPTREQLTAVVRSAW